MVRQLERATMFPDFEPLFFQLPVSISVTEIPFRISLRYNHTLLAPADRVLQDGLYV